MARAEVLINKMVLAVFYVYLSQGLCPAPPLEEVPFQVPFAVTSSHCALLQCFNLKGALTTVPDKTSHEYLFLMAIEIPFFLSPEWFGQVKI